MNKNQKKSFIFLISVIALTALFLFAIKVSNKETNQNQEIEPLSQEQIDSVDNQTQNGRDIWLSNKAINSDYVGEIVFESNLINKSFVQAKDVYDKNGEPYHFYTENGHLVTDYENYTGNDVYIWTDWTTMTYDYDIKGGSVFMDYRGSLDDINIIIYGHHFSEAGGHDPDRIKAFTPLELLLNEDYYEDNKYLEMILDNETRKYELAYVYVYDAESDLCNEKCQYYRTDYNYDEFNDVVEPEYYDEYISTMEELKQYDTDCVLTSNDATLTLQTCISGSNTKFEICVFKLIDTQYYEG